MSASELSPNMGKKETAQIMQTTQQLHKATINSSLWENITKVNTQLVKP